VLRAVLVVSTGLVLLVLGTVALPFLIGALAALLPALCAAPISLTQAGETRGWCEPSGGTRLCSPLPRWISQQDCATTCSRITIADDWSNAWSDYPNHSLMPGSVAISFRRHP
jgi:hypothetical protein